MRRQCSFKALGKSSVVSVKWSGGGPTGRGRLKSAHLHQEPHVKERSLNDAFHKLGRGALAWNTHVNDAPDTIAVRALLDHGQQRLRERKHALDVEREELGERRVRVLLEGGAPGRTRVVDEDVEDLLARADLLGEAQAFVVLAEVAGDGDALAWPLGGELGGRRVARFGVARGDVDLSAVGDIGCSDLGSA